MYRTILFIFILTTGLLAQGSGNPENWCREGLFTHDPQEFGIGEIKPTSGVRAYFYNDDPESCPQGRTCRTKSYVVIGDTIVTAREYKGFVCSWFTSQSGGVKVGWIRENHIEFPNFLSDGSARAWSGDWSYASNSIKLFQTKDKDVLKVSGNAVWKGMGDNIHVGELDGLAPFPHGILKYSEGAEKYDCNVRMELAIEKYLIVIDNGNCGGANVTFSGIYSKVR
jgi:hypothetical protein